MTNFWQAIKDIKWSQPREIEFRVYYDKDGHVLCYSNDDLNGHYIIVDKNTWHANRFDRRVIDGKLVEIKILPSKLVPSDQGRCCCPEDVSILVTENSPHIKWKFKKNESY